METFNKLVIEQNYPVENALMKVFPKTPVKPVNKEWEYILQKGMVVLGVNGPEVREDYSFVRPFINQAYEQASLNWLTLTASGYNRVELEIRAFLKGLVRSQIPDYFELKYKDKGLQKINDTAKTNMKMRRGLETKVNTFLTLAGVDVLHRATTEGRLEFSMYKGEGQILYFYKCLPEKFENFAKYILLIPQ